MRAELTWKPSPTNNPLELHVPIPPPTAESRAADAALASQEGEKALLGVRNARGSCHKRLRKMELEKKARPDDLRKAGKTMESIVEKATVEVKKAVDATKKAVMG
jgi:ribosome recycling factor